MEKEQPIEPEVREKMIKLGYFLDEYLNGSNKNNRKWGFALLVFKFGSGKDHRSNYLSNCIREDMIATMKEFIARNEGTYIDPTIKTQ